MTLSLFSDYSLRLLMYAAIKGELFQIEEVTEAYGVSKNHLAKVVQALAKLGYLETRRGRGGGILLAKEPATIRLGALIRATENQPAMVECFDPATNTCPINGRCQLKGFLAEAMKAFYDSLDQHTLAELVAGRHRKGLERILFPPPVQ